MGRHPRLVKANSRNLGRNISSSSHVSRWARAVECLDISLCLSALTDSSHGVTSVIMGQGQREASGITCTLSCEEDSAGTSTFFSIPRRTVALASEGSAKKFGRLAVRLFSLSCFDPCRMFPHVWRATTAGLHTGVLKHSPAALSE